MDHVDDVLHVGRSFVLASDGDFLGVVQVVLRNAGYLGAHGGREEQGVSLFGHVGQDGVDAVGEAHVEHLVGLVHHYVLDGGQGDGLALHEVEQTAGGSHDDVHAAFQGLDLALDGRTAVDGQHTQAVDVFAVVVQIARNLEAELTCGTEHERLGNMVLYVDFLYQRQAEGRRLSGACLCQGHHVIVFSQEAGDYFFLYRHGLFVAHLFDGAAYLRRHTELFKCLH